MMLLTFLMMKEGEHQLVSTEAGFRQIEHLQLNFYGVKSEAQEQRIQVINPSKILAVKTFFESKTGYIFYCLPLSLFLAASSNIKGFESHGTLTCLNVYGKKTDHHSAFGVCDLRSQKADKKFLRPFVIE